jgi:hypothetical protein
VLLAGSRPAGKALLPFDVETGRLVDDVWAQLARARPVRMAPARRRALRSCGGSTSTRARATSTSSTRGAAFARELDALGVEYSLELFDGTHGGLTYRYPGAIRELILALNA